MNDPNENPCGSGPESNPSAAAGEECGHPWAKVRSAADAVRLAKAELHKAQEFYHRVRRETSDRVEAVRNKTVGDLLDDAIGVVKKHPAAGLAVALAVGIFLGRKLKR
jgi:ElaB/YqjD/DUF883 family membrane-anchored ribosome-binding protein